MSKRSCEKTKRMTKIYCLKSTLETDNLSFSKNRYQNYMKHPHVLFKFRKNLQMTFWFLSINYLTAWLNLTTTIYSIILHCKSCWCLYLASTKTIKANCVKLSQGPGLCRTGVLVSFHKQKNKGNAPLILNSVPYTLTLLELFIFIFSEATLNPPPAHRNFTPILKAQKFAHSPIPCRMISMHIRMASSRSPRANLMLASPIRPLKARGSLLRGLFS